MGPGKTRYRVPNRFGAGLGDRVSLTVADGTVVSAALYSYLVPALMTILMAAVGQAWFGNVGAIMGALVGLVLSVALLRRRESLLGAGDEILVAARPSKVDCDELERRK
jgi:positive regulator of sigma E activity